MSLCKTGWLNSPNLRQPRENAGMKLNFYKFPIRKSSFSFHLKLSKHIMCCCKTRKSSQNSQFYSRHLVFYQSPCSRVVRHLGLTVKSLTNPLLIRQPEQIDRHLVMNSLPCDWSPISKDLQKTFFISFLWYVTVEIVVTKSYTVCTRMTYVSCMYVPNLPLPRRSIKIVK